MTATAIDVVMFQECRRRQHDVGHLGRFGHELLVHADEQVLARKALLDLGLVGADRERIGVLHDHRRHRRPAPQRLGIAGQDRADARLVEHAHRAVPDVESFDQRLVELVDIGIDVEGAAALQLPGPAHRRDAAGRVHVGGAVARAREAVAEPKKSALALADQSGELLDGLHRRAGDRRGPGRIAVPQVRFQLARRVGVFVEIIPVRVAVAEQAMHHRAGQRAVAAGFHQHRQIGLLHGAVHVDVDRRDLGAALFARAHGVGHHIDLGADRVGAPDHHQIGFRHLARIGPAEVAGAGGKAGIGRVDADRGVEAGIFLDVAQPVDAVAHQQAHGAGILVRPHGFGAVFLLSLHESLGHQVERVVPGDRRELARALGAGAAQRMQQPVFVMLALGIARHFRAYHAGGVVVVLGAVHAADGALINQLDFERAGRRAIVRAGRITGALEGEFDDLIHRPHSIRTS